MNDDSSPSTSDIPLQDSLAADLQGITVEAGPSLEDDRRIKIRLQQGKRATFLDDLIRNLDIMIYFELSVFTYSCSLFRFFLRALPQWFYFTPKPVFFPSPPPNRPYIAAIVLPNFCNALLHTYSNAPAAGEAMRGYIHGALLIDFVGELGPISKFRLVALDIMVMVLQFVILAIVLERAVLKKDMESSLGPARTTTSEESGLAGQDLDAEEQGLHRSSMLGGDIELQPLHSSAAERRDDDGLRVDAFHESISPRSSRIEHPLDTFNSGQHVIVNLHIIETIRTSYQRWKQVDMGVASTSDLSPTARMSVANRIRRSRARTRAVIANEANI